VVRAFPKLSRGGRRTLALSAVALVIVSAAVASRIDRQAIAAPQSVTTPAASRVDRDQLMQAVRTLASPEFEGRRTGSPGGLAARRFIRDAFASSGLTPAAPGFLQQFEFVHSSVADATQPGRATKTTYGDAANVIAVEPGSRRDARTIVVSAHYDHVGIQDGVLYPGADDNASGVAALLAIARYVHAHPLSHRVIFAAFDAEELGLEGAQAFLRTPPVPTGSIALNVNLDMVSRNDRNEIFAAGTFHTPSLKPIVEDVQQRSAVKILLGHDRPTTRANKIDDWTLQSDHGAFHKAGIPFLYFGVEDHPDYHKPTDTADKIDPTFFSNVVEMLIDVVVTADRKIQ
jgi:hypothetical protein